LRVLLAYAGLHRIFDHLALCGLVKSPHSFGNTRPASFRERGDCALLFCGHGLFVMRNCIDLAVKLTALDGNLVTDPAGLVRVGLPQLAQVDLLKLLKLFQ
jgi:hypothetical protein